MASSVDASEQVSIARDRSESLPVDNKHCHHDQTKAEHEARGGYSPEDSLPESSNSTRVFPVENQEHQFSVEMSQIANQEQHSVQGNGQYAKTTAKLCDCGRLAVLKVAGPRSENNGLRYLCCDRFAFFRKKNKCCRFFEWVDCPRVTKEQKKEARAQKCKKVKVDSESFSVPAVLTRVMVRQLGNECQSIQDVQPDIEINAFGINVNDAHQETTISQTWRDITDDSTLVADLPTEAQLPDDLDQNDQKSLSKEHGEDFAKDLSTVEMKRITVTETVREIGASIEIVQDLELNIEKTAESGVCAVGLGLNMTDDVQKSPTRSAANKSSEEVPVCLCSRDAILKIVNKKGPNKGKRFWVCSNSKPFYIKQRKHKTDGTERSCKFFRWVDAPFVKSEDQKIKEKEKKREMNKQRELALLT